MAKRPNNSAQSSGAERRGKPFEKGTSGNPGGVPRVSLELRKLALQHAPRAMQRAVELLESDDPRLVDVGLSHVLNRALGRPGPPAELPDDMPTAEPTDTSPAALLDLSMRGLARVLESFDRRTKSGHPLSQSEVETLAEASRTLSVLAKEEREISKQGNGAALSDAELSEKVLALLPLEKLEAALKARRK